MLDVGTVDEREVDRSRHVGRRHNEHVREPFDGVDLSQQGVDDANGVRGFVGGSLASRGQAFDFVDQNADEYFRILDHLLNLFEPIQ